MVHRCHHEADAVPRERVFDDLRADHDVDAEGRLHVGRARPSTTGCGCRVWATGTPAPATDEGGGGGDVERAHPVAAGSDDVHRAFGGLHGQALVAHHRSRGGVFGDGLATGAEGHQEASDLRGGAAPIEEDGGTPSFRLARELAALGGGVDQGLIASLMAAP